MPNRILTFPLRALRKLLTPVSRKVSGILFDWRSRNREYLSRQLLFDTIVGFIGGGLVEGDYLEFGCFGGGSLVDIYRAVRRYPLLSAARFFIFDSFEGLPEPTGLDIHEFRIYERGQYACSLDQYKRNIQKLGVPMDRVQCIPGWYNKTLNAELKAKLPIKKAAIVLVDCDLYESTVPVLDFITDYVQDGTVLIFDDWFSYKGRLDLGEARAFYEWLARNPRIHATEYHKAGVSMISFIMKVDEPVPANDAK